MRVIKCKKGHYYDGEIYTRCPHCSNTEINEEKNNRKTIIGRLLSVKIKSTKAAKRDAGLEEKKDFNKNDFHEIEDNSETIDWKGENLTEYLHHEIKNTEDDGEYVTEIFTGVRSVPSLKQIRLQSSGENYVLGFLVKLNDPDKGSFTALYMKDNAAVNELIEYDRSDNKFYIAANESKKIIKLNGSVCENDKIYLDDRDVFEVDGGRYLFIEVCKGFSWTD